MNCNTIPSSTREGQQQANLDLKWACRILLFLYKLNPSSVGPIQNQLLIWALNQQWDGLVIFIALHNFVRAVMESIPCMHVNACLGNSKMFPKDKGQETKELRIKQKEIFKLVSPFSYPDHNKLYKGLFDHITTIFVSFPNCKLK